MSFAREMKRFGIAVCAIVIVIACRRAATHHGSGFDRNAFILTTLQTTLADNDLGAIAARRGRRPETRQLGATLHREQHQLFSQLSAIAQREKIAVPATIEPKKAALEENLSILSGEDFDRGYTLAMLQDANAMSASFRAASTCGDPLIENFAKQNLPVIASEQQSAAALLKSLGGSPFGFVP